MQVLSGFHGINGKAVHKYQFGQNEQEKGQTDYEIIKCCVAQPFFQAFHEVEAKIDIIDQIHGSYRAGQKNQKETQGDIEWIEGGLQTAQWMLPDDQVIVVKLELRAGEKSADCCTD